MDWIEIPPGPFLMGSHKGESPLDDETPQFECKLITAPYRISRYPVTVAQYQAFVDAGGYADKDRDWWTTDGWKWKVEQKITGPVNYDPVFQTPNHLRVGVSWFEATAFCRWLSEQTSQVIQLPSEAEWERAARHTDVRKYPWGGEEACAQRCNMRDTGISSTCAVGLFPSGNSVCGAADMAGNVWEWCRAKLKFVYMDYERMASDAPDGNDTQVLRGGAFNFDPGYLRCSNRNYNVPGSRNFIYGFRVVCGVCSAR